MHLKVPILTKFCQFSIRSRNPPNILMSKSFSEGITVKEDAIIVDPKEDSITEDPKEDFITEDHKKDPISDNPKGDSITEDPKGPYH